MAKEVEVPQLSGPPAYQGETWEELTQGVHEVFGADLEKGQQLIGVPMCLILATFRLGDFADKDGVKGYYVSLDAVIAPLHDIEKGIRRQRIPAENAEYAMETAGDHVVFNEGGTGVYRQVVSYLEATGRIRILNDKPREGGYGESRFDTAPPDWEVDSTAELRTGEDGAYGLAFSIRLLCPRGLRSSEYENQFTKQGVTRYIA